MPATRNLAQVVADVWADVLGVEAVEPGDGFFALGGYSQQALRTVHLLRDKLSVPVTLRDLMTASSLAEFTDTVRARLDGGTPARPVVALTGRRGTR